MAYVVKNYEHLIGMEGLTETLLRNHFKLYEGYVNNTNKILEELSKIDPASPEYSELRRRFGWEFNGMRLHELFFGNISKTPKAIAPNSKLDLLIKNQFGSFTDFEKEIKSILSMRGIGWVILTYDASVKRLFCIWVNEHDLGHLVGTIPLLVLDVFEHAYMLDYGLKKADYVNTIFKSVDWSVVDARLK